MSCGSEGLMSCYLEDYRAYVGTWDARTSWRTVQGQESNGQAISYIGNTLLCAATLTALLVINGVEQNPGPGVEVEHSLQILCSGCERNFKLGTQCDMCGHWFHNSCGNVKLHNSCANVKLQIADSGKWSCDRYRWDRLRQLEEKLEDALQQIEELKRKNKGIEEHLRVAECLVLGDSIIQNVESAHESTVLSRN
jgi:hypothetical protein